MSDGLSDEVKGAIVLEVHSQLNPLKSTVDRLDRTVRSLYSTGTPLHEAAGTHGGDAGPAHWK